jgi:hypothetical protein
MLFSLSFFGYGGAINLNEILAIFSIALIYLIYSWLKIIIDFPDFPALAVLPDLWIN